jgi:aminoglycoside phosphotransferase (APT) family kinase protein
MALTEDAIQSGLRRLYRGSTPSVENVQIRDLVQIGDGWENDVYSFVMERGRADGRQCEHLILRIYPGEDAQEKSAREYHAMKKLYAAGYPVPQVLLLKTDGTWLSRPFVIMEQIAGRSLGAVLGESSQEKVLELLTYFCRMFVDLHALDWRPFAPVPSPVQTEGLQAALSRRLTRWQAHAHTLLDDAFDPVFAWLDARLPGVQVGRPSVIHMDYHPYNILLRDDGTACVIDWTNVQVSDYRMDLAWTLLLMSTYGTPEAREIVLGEYERIVGRRIEQIEFFEVAACLRRLFSIQASLSVGAGKMGMRPGAEAMMKDVPHITSVYAHLRERTGLAIAAIERLLASLS